MSPHTQTHTHSLLPLSLSLSLLSEKNLFAFFFKVSCHCNSNCSFVVIPRLRRIPPLPPYLFNIFPCCTFDLIRKERKEYVHFISLSLCVVVDMDAQPESSGNDSLDHVTVHCIPSQQFT
jgi:hypothetical protein